jgi:hypothetical protein
MLGRGNIYNYRSDRVGNGAGMDGEQNIFIIGPLTVERNNKWIQSKQYTVPETSKLLLTRKQRDTILSPIPRSLAAFLNTNKLMTGAHIEQLLSHLVSSDRNMSFMGTYVGPSLQHEGQLYWDYIMGTKRINYAQKV